MEQRFIENHPERDSKGKLVKVANQYKVVAIVENAFKQVTDPYTELPVVLQKLFKDCDYYLFVLASAR